MTKLTLRMAALTLLCGLGFLVGPSFAAPQQRAAKPNTSEAIVDRQEAAEPEDFEPASRRSHRVRYPSRGPRNRGVLVNTCDTFPCGSWPSYYDMPPPIRPRVFYGYYPHRNGWPGDRRGWYRWDW